MPESKVGAVKELTVYYISQCNSDGTPKIIDSNENASRFAAKRVNYHRVLDLLKDQGPLNCHEIARKLNISPERARSVAGELYFDEKIDKLGTLKHRRYVAL